MAGKHRFDECLGVTSASRLDERKPEGAAIIDVRVRGVRLLP